MRGEIDLLQPLTDHPINDGLLSAWIGLDGNAGGTNLYDIQGGNTLALTNTPTWSYASGGTFPELLFVAASSQHAVSAAASSPNAVAFWLRIDISGDVGCVYAGADVYDSTFWTWSCFLFGGAIFFGANAAAAFINDTIVTGRWDHYVLNRSDTDGVSRLYKNGAALGTAATTSTSSGITRIAKAAGASYFTGGVRDLMQWNRPLPASQAAGLYAEGRQDYPNILRRLSPRSWFLMGAEQAGGGGGNRRRRTILSRG